MRLNKKGNIIGFGFALVAFIFVWATWLANFLNEQGAIYIATNDPNPFELFFYSNLNLFVFMGLVLAIMIYFSLGGGQSQ